MNFPDNHAPIQVFDGRYGPYVKADKETRSLPVGVSPLEITLDEAIALLRTPKTRGRAAPKEPIKVFENKSPVTENEVKILDGRFGPYVTDGETNASVPRGVDAKEMTFEAAIDLLAERAAKGPTKKKKKKKAAQEEKQLRRRPRQRKKQPKRKLLHKKKGLPKKKS